MTATRKNAAAHPNVIGLAVIVDEYTIRFDLRDYLTTGKTGHSVHDGIAVEEYVHEQSGGRVWKDAQNRVHADSHDDLMSYLA